MSAIPVICHNCGTIGSVNRVTASLRCTCGSDDLDLFDEKEASKQGPKTGWPKNERNDPEAGWNEYEGPLPHANPNVERDNDPSFKDGEYAIHRGNPGYIPGGGYDVNTPQFGPYTPPVESYDATTDGPPIGGARWQGQNAPHRATKVTPKKVTKHVSKQTRLAQIMGAIAENNQHLSDDTIFRLASRAVEISEEV